MNSIRLRMVREPLNTNRKTISGWFLLIALILLCTNGWLLLGRTPVTDSLASKSTAASPLFDRSEACSQPNRALYRAREAERAALAKMERYPFMQHDGVEAVQLILDARNCYQAAGKDSQVVRVQNTLDTWKRYLERDYRSLRRRLGFALVRAQRDEAMRTVRILQNLLSHRNDDYKRWLDRVERNLNAP